MKSVMAKAAESLPTNTSPFVGEAGKSSGPYREGRLKEKPQHISNVDGYMVQGEAQTSITTKKKARRSQKKKPIPNTQDPPAVMDVEVSRNGNDMSGSVKRGKGWRQTPLLQPSPQNRSPLNQDSPSGKSRRTKEAQQNGWATEEATDIQDLGDFDFEANHKLFDKKQIFDGIRQGDTTADDERLVSHNKVHKPGTYGGRNLHPTENVLSPQLASNDSTSDADTELNGRSSSKHSLSRVAMKKAPSRQNSTQVDGGGSTRPHPLSASMSSDRGGLARSTTSFSSKVGRPLPSVATSYAPSKKDSPISATSATRVQPPSTISEPHFAIKNTLTPCPVLLPSALETLEQETVSRYGLTHEAITETAARSIAETAMGMFNIPSRRPSRTNTLRGHPPSNTDTSIPQPVVVILAGNHTTGARALAAVRHLLTRNTKIIIAEASSYEGSSSESSSQHPQMKSQSAILKRMLKAGAPIKRGPWTRAYNQIRHLPGPPAVIIDALLAGADYDATPEGRASGAQQRHAEETREIIEWANRSRAPVLSIACPAGVSGTDGSAPVVEGEPLAIRPEKVLALGAPMLGLLLAVKGGEKWAVALADVGVNIALRREEGMGFGTGWVVELGFVEEGGFGGGW